MWLRDELSKLDPDRGELRKFAVVLGGALLVLGSFAAYRDSAAAPFLLVPAGLILAVGLALPAALRWLFYAWMAIGLVLGTIVTALILTAVFLIAIIPIALVMRLFGRDPIERRLDPEAETYWIAKSRPIEDVSRLEKYF